MSREIRIRQPRNLPRGQLPRKRRWPWIVALLAVLVGLGWYSVHHHAEAVEADSAPRSFAAPRGSRNTTARCFIVVIDESSSMAGSDPNHLRAGAINETVRFLRAYGLPGDELGGGWFADSTAFTDPSTVGSVTTDWSAPNVGGGTNMVAAVVEAEQKLGQCSAQPVLLLVTDGQADDMTAVGNLIRGLSADTRVHLVAMNIDGGYDSIAQAWEDPALGIDSIERIDEVRPLAVAQAIAHILELETGQQIAVD